MPADAHDRTVLSIVECMASLRLEGDRLVEVAAGAPLDARVPGCPGWDIEALVRHMGDVHRWAGTVVRDRVQAQPTPFFTAG